MVPFSILKEHQGRGVCTPMLIHVDVSQKSTQDCKPIISQLKIIFFLKRASLQPLLPSPRILFLLLTSCFPFTKTLTIFSGPTRYFCMISSSKDLYLSHLQSPFCHEGSIFIGSRDTMQPFGGKEPYSTTTPPVRGQWFHQKALSCLTPHSRSGMLVQQTPISLQLQTPRLLALLVDEFISAEERVGVISVVMTPER